MEGRGVGGVDKHEVREFFHTKYLHDKYNLCVFVNFFVCFSCVFYDGAIFPPQQCPQCASSDCIFSMFLGDLCAFCCVLCVFCVWFVYGLCMFCVCFVYVFYKTGQFFHPGHVHPYRARFMCPFFKCFLSVLKVFFLSVFLSVGFF